MSSIMEIMQLCRLCLVKDQVNFPIFEEQGDIRQIFLKITACLPVKVAKDDNLPKKICDGCLYKLELLYQFWNTAANAEKQLLTWLSQAGMDADAKTTHDAVAVAQQSQAHSHSVKQEVVEPCENENKNENSEDLSTEAQNYIIQQQQLPYESVGFPYEEENFNETQESNGGGDEAVSEEQEGPLPKRRRRQCAETVVEPEEAEEDDDDISQEMPVTKTEEESDTEEETRVEDGEPTNFVPIGGSGDNEQPGPSGMGKVASEAPADVQIDEIKSKESNKITDDEKSPNKFPDQAKFVVLNRASKNTLRLLTKTNNGNFKHVVIKNSQLKLLKKNVSSNTKLPCKSSVTDVKNIKFERKYVVLDDKLKAKLEETCKINGERKLNYKMIICESCGKDFSSTLKFQRHMATHSAENFKCSFCGKVFKNSGSVQKHENIHKGVRFPCEICGKEIATKNQLEIHVRKHKGQYKHKCEECGKEYYNNKAYRQHMESEHKGIRYKCEICGSVLRSRRYLKDHMVKHTDTNIKRYLCQICKKFYSSKAALNGHMKIHVGKRYECSVCGKKSTQKVAHIVHMRLHTGEKNYICEVCGKNFARKDMLQAHIRRVHEVSKYNCNYCNFEFKTEHNLLIHLHTHEEIEKKFPCEYCDEKFIDLNFLRSHVNKVHIENKSDKIAEHKQIEDKVMCVHCKKFYPKSYIRLHEAKRICRQGCRKSLICSVCKKHFNHFVNYKTHVKFAHQNQRNSPEKDEIFEFNDDIVSSDGVIEVYDKDTDEDEVPINESE